MLMYWVWKGFDKSRTKGCRALWAEISSCLENNLANFFWAIPLKTVKKTFGFPDENDDVQTKRPGSNLGIKLHFLFKAESE